MNFQEIRSLFDFAHFKDFFESLDRLASLAMPENWNHRHPHTKQNQKTPILENYIHHTFRRLLQEASTYTEHEDSNSIIYLADDLCCFNTGLYTSNYNAIYGLFYPSRVQFANPKPWFFFGFVDESNNRLNSIPKLPRRACYISSISDLLYDTSYELRLNADHILEENRGRFPESVRDLPYLQNIFEGAVNIAKKRVDANYRIAIPTCFRNTICMLLPLDLQASGSADLALAVQKMEGFYAAKTCLTLDMAYNDARLIAKPDDEWLRP